MSPPDVIPDEVILRACRDYQAGWGYTPDQALSGQYSREQVLAKMRDMIRRRLLECGKSLLTAWPRGEHPGLASSW